MGFYLTKRVLHKRILQCVLAIGIIYALLPMRFAVQYEYIPNEEIQYHLVPFTKPNSKSCPLLPKLNKYISLYDRNQKINETLAVNHLNIQKGGFWKPENCDHVHDVALIIPYRGRPKQLDIFLHYIHYFLQKQLISYRIFVIEQTYYKAFNRGLLLNVGFLEALKLHEFHCFIFHDVDLLPLVEFNIYACTDKPRHMSSAINTWRFNLKYKTAFGGVVAILKKHFYQINGFSNKYFGWGGEDDDLMERVQDSHLGYLRFSPEISKYHMLHHKPEEKSPDRLEYLGHAKKRFHIDGINSINYTKLKFEENTLYTHVLVDPRYPFTMTSRLLCVDFEVFGKVQGVFFRKHTMEKATALGLRGWCMNTIEGTVKGSMEGEPEKIEEMKHWLKFKGSPQSRIDKASFSNEVEIDKFSYDKFFVKR